MKYLSHEVLTKTAKNEMTRQDTRYRGTKAIGANTLGDYDNAETVEMAGEGQKDRR